MPCWRSRSGKVATSVCPESRLVPNLPFLLTFEPASRVTVRSFRAFLFSRFARSCPVISDCFARTLRVLLSGHFGLLCPYTSRVPVRPSRTFPSFLLACSCPVISDGSPLTLRVSLSGHFGLLSFRTCAFLSGHFGFPRLHLRVLLSGHFGHSLIRHFFIFVRARAFRA